MLGVDLDPFLALFQVLLNLADGLRQGLVVGVLGQQLEDFVVGQTLPQQVSADPHKEHDLAPRRFEVYIDKLAIDPQHPVIKLAQAVFDLFLGKGLLLAANGFVVADLGFVGKGHLLLQRRQFKILL